MKQKKVSLPIFLIVIICTVICSVYATYFYLFNQPGAEYKATLAAVVLSNDGTQLTIKGESTNLKGTSGSYVVKFDKDLAIYDSNKNAISFSDLEGGSLLTIYYKWKIPQYANVNTNFEDFFKLEENQVIPDVLAIALSREGTESGIDFFDSVLTE